MTRLESATNCINDMEIVNKILKEDTACGIEAIMQDVLDYLEIVKLVREHSFFSELSIPIVAGGGKRYYIADIPVIIDDNQSYLTALVLSHGFAITETGFVAILEASSDDQYDNQYVIVDFMNSDDNSYSNVELHDIRDDLVQFYDDLNEFYYTFDNIVRKISYRVELASKGDFCDKFTFGTMYKRKHKDVDEEDMGIAILESKNKSENKKSDEIQGISEEVSVSKDATAEEEIDVSQLPISDQKTDAESEQIDASENVQVITVSEEAVEFVRQQFDSGTENVNAENESETGGKSVDENEDAGEAGEEAEGSESLSDESVSDNAENIESRGAEDSGELAEDEGVDAVDEASDDDILEKETLDSVSRNLEKLADEALQDDELLKDLGLLSSDETEEIQGMNPMRPNPRPEKPIIKSMSGVKTLPSATGTNLLLSSAYCPDVRKVIMESEISFEIPVMRGTGNEETVNVKFSLDRRDVRLLPIDEDKDVELVLHRDMKYTLFVSNTPTTVSMDKFVEFLVTRIYKTV